jgi:hypothetical protein
MASPTYAWWSFAPSLKAAINRLRSYEGSADFSGTQWYYRVVCRNETFSQALRARGDLGPVGDAGFS